MEKTIPRVSVPRSSNISEIGYDENTRTLVIKFHHGGLYKYSPITAKSYLNFLRSTSKGEWFQKNIKNNKLIDHKKI